MLAASSMANSYAWQTVADSFVSRGGPLSHGAPHLSHTHGGPLPTCSSEPPRRLSVFPFC